MELTKTIQSKSEIIDSLHTSFDKVAASIQAIPNDVFYRQKNNKWSIAENMDHLIRSNKPLASVLKKNKLYFLTFGISFRGSEDYETLYTNYLLKLSQRGIGPPAGNGFAPVDSEKISKETFLKNWKLIRGKYEGRLKKWSEKDLDRFRLPHPLLGKLTLREMLLFTIFHNEHHLKAIEFAKH